MRAVLITGIFLLACGGRTLSDPIYDDEPWETSGSGGGGTNSGGTGVAKGGTPNVPKGGTPNVPKGGTSPMGGVAGRNPGRGGASGAGTGGVITGGSAGFGATPNGGSFPGGSAGFAGGGQTGGGGTGGTSGAVECKGFCGSIGRWCEEVGTDPASCFKNCYAAFSSEQVVCRQETLDAMNCVTKALSALPGDRCVSSLEITRYCAAELARQAMCEGSPTPIPTPPPVPACMESGSSAPDSCVWVRQCGAGDYAVLECRQPTPGAGASCECWVNGSLLFATTTTPDWPVEKVCFEPAVNSACQPF